MKEDFLVSVSHIVYTEPIVLREDFDFADYLTRAQAKCHLQLFSMSITTLLILTFFLLLVSLVDYLVESDVISCAIISFIPVISFWVAWQENKRMLAII